MNNRAAYEQWIRDAFYDETDYSDPFSVWVQEVKYKKLAGIEDEPENG